MKVLLAYATNSGGTYLAAERIEKILERVASVQMQKANDTEAAHLKDYDLIIFGTPSWSVEGHEGYPHETMLRLIRGLNPETMSGKQFALFGCGDTSYTYFCGAVDFLEKWLTDNSLQPVVPSLRIDGYFFDLIHNERLVDEWARRLSKLVGSLK